MSSTTDTKQQNIVMTLLLLNAFATSPMLSAVNVALPSIAEDLQLSAIALSWILMGYLMTSVMFILISGPLADIHGRKKVFLIGTVCYRFDNSCCHFPQSHRPHHCTLLAGHKCRYALCHPACLPGLFFSLLRGRIHQEKQ